MDILSKEVDAISFLNQQLTDSKLAVSFSGGKDSLVALDLCSRVGIDKVVFSNTTIEFDETLDYISTIEDYYGITIDMVKANVEFFDLVERVGFPSRRLRWCCDVFKFGPLAKYAIDNSLDGYITGLRQDESARRAAYSDVDSNQMVPIKQINPLLKWNKESIWKYIKKYDLPANPLYTKFERVGCWCCPYKTIDEWDMLEANFPNLIGKLERKLDSFADKIGIQDKTEFIKNKKWTGWATSQSNGKVPIGTRKLCTSLNDSNTMDFAFFGNDESQAEKVKNLLPILTDDYRLIGSALRVTVEKNKNKRLNTLIEKAINCVGCGACTASCPEGALYVDSQSIFVKSDLCTHCERCLHTQILKGACVVRNYAPRKRTITAYA